MEAPMAMNVGAARDGEPVSEINTTPLIDVMLVLLIMLIITLPPQRHAVELDTPIPCPDCEWKDDLPDPVSIAVDLDGSISWNGVGISRTELRQRFAAEARRAIQPEIHIAPHRRARYGVIAHVMAAAQREGLTRMGIVDGA
jgi:biopolymer transport protein ExbD